MLPAFCSLKGIELFTVSENKIKPTRLETIFLKVILSYKEFCCNRTLLNFCSLLCKQKLLNIVNNEEVLKKFSSLQLEPFTIESFLFICIFHGNSGE